MDLSKTGIKDLVSMVNATDLVLKKYEIAVEETRDRCKWSVNDPFYNDYSPTKNNDFEEHRKNVFRYSMFLEIRSKFVDEIEKRLEKYGKEE